MSELSEWYLTSSDIIPNEGELCWLYDSDKILKPIIGQYIKGWWWLTPEFTTYYEAYTHWMPKNSEEKPIYPNEVIE